MCIFCVGDDAPFYLRKSTAFPRKLTAEAVATDEIHCDQAGPEESAPEPDGAPEPKLPAADIFRRSRD